MVPAQTVVPAPAEVPVPLLVQVVAGNPATSAAVLLCLNTHDATILRQLHPALARTVADVPWCDTATVIHDMRRWRTALPAAVGARVSWRFSGNTAPLAGLTALDARQCNAITDAVVQRLPATLRRLHLQQCFNMTPAASFTHLPLLTALDCSRTAVFSSSASLGRLPPSLQELGIDLCRMEIEHTGDPAIGFGVLPALRELSWMWGEASDDIIATLPPSVEVVSLAYLGEGVGIVHLSRLPRLRVVRTRMFPTVNDAWVAALPAHLEELDVCGCRALTSAVSFTHLRALRTLNVIGTNIGDASLATLPPTLVWLGLSHCKLLSMAATLPALPALQLLDANNTSVGDAFVVSLPPCLTALYLNNCRNVTLAASTDHLTALRVLQCTDTHVSSASVAAVRARGGSVLA